MSSGRDRRRPDEPQQADQGATVTYTCECCGVTKEYDRTIFETLQRTRVARGLPFHIQDPAVLAQLATLILPSLKRERP